MPGLDFQRFLLELGHGFAFVGRQYRLEIGDDEFSINLLFYHLKLRSFVVIDLKTGAFKADEAVKRPKAEALFNGRLYSEDMQDGADYDGVTIVNPFA